MTDNGLSLEMKVVTCIVSKEKANQLHKLDENFHSQSMGLKRKLAF